MSNQPALVYATAHRALGCLFYRRHRPSPCLAAVICLQGRKRSNSKVSNFDGMYAVRKPINSLSVLNTAIQPKRTFCSSNNNIYTTASVKTPSYASRHFSSPNVVAPPPPIFDYILQQSFDKVLDRVRTHPHEVRFPHPRRWTALHACAEYGAPLEVLEALVDAYPDAVHMKDWRGNTPLDIAVLDETKEFLQAAAKRTTTDTDEQSTGKENGDDFQMERVLKRVDELSEQVALLTVNCKELSEEVISLRETLRGKL